MTAETQSLSKMYMQGTFTKKTKHTYLTKHINVTYLNSLYDVLSSHIIMSSQIVVLEKPFQRRETTCIIN